MQIFNKIFNFLVTHCTSLCGGPPPTSDETMYEWSLLRKLYLTLRMRVVAKAKAKMSAPGLVKPVVVDQLVLLVSKGRFK